MSRDIDRGVHEQHNKRALIAGVAAFGTWGLVPFYWKLVRTVPPAQILSHRVIWTVVFMAVLLTFQARWDEIRDPTVDRCKLAYCIGSGFAISFNWFLFILA